MEKTKKHKGRILIVEDEGVISLDLQNIVTELGYKVAGIATTGKKALEMAKKTKPDLVLMDIVLKGPMDGITAAAKIGSLYGAPSIFLTAYADEKRIERSKAVQPYGYILKPFQEGELKVAIEMAFYRLSMRDLSLVNDRNRTTSEDLLKASELRYRRLYDSMRDAYVSVDMSGHLLEFNEAYRKMLGYSEKELVKLRYQDITPKKWFAYEKKIVDKIIKQGDSDVYEKEYRRKDGTVFPVELRTSILRDKNGKPQGMWAIVRDISERKREEERLFESEKRYRSLFDTANLMIQSVGADSRYKYVNREWQKKLGYSQKELVRLSFLDVLKKEEHKHCLSAFGKLGKGESIYGIETVFVAKDGREIYVQGNIRPVMEKGKFISTIGFFMDVTERKRIERSLLVTKRHLEVISECDQALVRAENEKDLLNDICRIVCDKAGYKMAWVGFALNDRFKTVQVAASYGITKDYLEKAKITWSDTPRGRGPTGKAIRTSKPCINQDFETNPRLIPWRANARKLGFRSSMVFPLLNENGKAFGALSIYSSVTHGFPSEAIKPLKELTDDLAFGILHLRARGERKRAEEALRVGEQKYRGLYETLHDAYVQVDMSGRVVESNPLFRNMLGYSEKELIQLKHTDITPKKWHSIEARILKKQILKRGYSELYEKEYRRKDGTLVPIEIKTFLLRDFNGKPNGMWAIVRDISERKIAQEAIIESEEKFSAAFESSPNLISITRADDGTILDINKGYSNMLGYSRTESIGKTTGELSIWADPADREIFVDTLKRYGKITDFETKLRRKDGTLITVVDSARAIQLYGAMHILSVAYDITERKKAEEEIRRSAAELKEAQRIGHLGNFDWDARTDLITWSDEYYRIYGFKPGIKPPGYIDHLKTYSPESAARLDAAVKKSMKTGEPYTVDLEQVRPDGTRKWITARGEVKRDEKGKIVGLRGTALDITERKSIENELRESRFNLSLALRSADMGVWHLDIDENKRYFDEQVCRLLGIDPKKFKGTSGEFYKIVHPDDLPKVKETLNRTIKRGVSYKPEYRVIWPDGSLHYIATRGKLVRTADGRPSRINGIIWDITERKRVEEIIADLARFPLQNPNPIIRIRPNGEVLFQNDSAKKYFKNFSVSVYRIIKPQVRKSYQSKRILEVEINVRDQYFLLSITPLWSLGYLNLYARDITERKKAEEALRESEIEIKELVDTANSVILRWKPDGKVLYLNDFGYRLFGYTKGELVGKDVSVFVPRTESSGRDMYRYLKDIAIHPAKYAFTENENIRKNGERFWVAWTNKVIKDEQGRVKEILAIGNDISGLKNAESLLRENEKRYRALFNSMTNGFALHEIICDKRGKPIDYRFIEVNPAFEAMTGLKASDIIGKTVLEAMPGTEKRWIDTYGQVALTGRPAHFENYSSVLKRYYEVSAYSPKPRHFATLVTDITPRKKLDEELSSLSMRQQSILGAVPDILMQVDNHKTYTWANPAGIEFFGKDVIGKKASHYFEGEQKTYTIVKPLFSGKEKTIYLESWQRRKDGQIRLLAWWCRTLKGKSGKVIGALSSARDITDQRKTEDEVKSSELRYRRLFESAKDGILILDYDTGMVVDVNPYLTHTLGLHRFKLIGKQLWQLGFFKDIIQNKANFLELKQKRIIRYENLPMETADGRKLHVEFVSNVYDAGGSKVIQCNIRDITERWKADELKNQFLDITTHELKTPLIPIRSQCQSLLQGDLGLLDDRQKESVEMIYRKENQMEKLVTDILDLTKARSNALNLAFEKRALGKVLDEAVDNVADIAKNKKIAFFFKIPPVLPRLSIDPKRIAQVIDNLLSNALKNTPHGGRIFVEAYKMNGSLAVSVRDTGIGMGKDVIGQLFTPFYQADKTASRKFGGAGLGLAISKEIVEAHGGKIWAESPGKNKGSTFIFTLPLKNGKKHASRLGA